MDKGVGSITYAIKVRVSQSTFDIRHHKFITPQKNIYTSIWRGYVSHINFNLTTEEKRRLGIDATIPKDIAHMFVTSAGAPKIYDTIPAGIFDVVLAQA